MNKPATDWSEMVKEIQADRRSGKRLNLFFPIEIQGTDANGALFREQTKTQDISESGCRFETTLTLIPGDIIAIKLNVPEDSVQNRKPQLFEIAWSAPIPTGRSVGARKLQGAKLWLVNFPPAKDSGEPTKD